MLIPDSWYILPSGGACQALLESACTVFVNDAGEHQTGWLVQRESDGAIFYIDPRRLA